MVVVLAGGAVVVTVDSTTVVAASGAVVGVVVDVVLEDVVLVVGPVGLDVDVIPPGAIVVVVVVGSPIATGVSTTRSRMPATAVDAINTESAVAPNHARPIRQYLLIHPSMHHPTSAWVKRRLNDDQTTVIHCAFARSGCTFL